EPRPRGARGRQSVRVRVVLQPAAAQGRDRLARKLGGDRLTDGLSRGRFREGVVLSLALVPSVFVYATVFGGLAVQAGLHVVEVLAMSVLVFAGASQFVAVPMIAASASPAVAAPDPACRPARAGGADGPGAGGPARGQRRRASAVGRRRSLRAGRPSREPARERGGGCRRRRRPPGDRVRSARWWSRSPPTSARPSLLTSRISTVRSSRSPIFPRW